MIPVAYVHKTNTHPRRVHCAKSIKADFYCVHGYGLFVNLRNSFLIAWRLWRENKHKVILLDNGSVVVVAFFLKRLFRSKVKILFYLCEPFYSLAPNYKENAKRTFLQDIFYSQLLGSVDGFITNSTVVYNCLKERYSKKPLYFVPSFLTEPLSHYAKIKPTARNIVRLGHYRPEKAYDVLLEAFSRVLKKFPKTQLYILGRATKENIPPTKNVHVVGEAEPTQYLAKGIFYVHPSRFEAWNVAVMEAMACGLVPLVTKRVENYHMIAEVHPKLVIEEPEVESLTKRMNWLLGLDNITLRKLSEKARKVVQPYSLEHGLGLFKKAYNDILRDFHLK